jgi:hypothetical protein
VVSDPPIDKEFPPALAVITVPGHGVEMDGTFYLAGAGSHGTVRLLHRLSAGGWNVLLFHYRGTWVPRWRSHSHRR